MPKPSTQSSTLEKAPVGRQRDLAYRGLRRLLIIQQVPGGERLREPYWAAQLGVNRMALREAFARLEAEGLIERGAKTGYFVPLIGEKDVREIMRVRTILECGAIELICEASKLIDRCVRQLRKCCRDFDGLLSRRYAMGVSEADRRFHETIIDAAGSRRLSSIYHHAPLPLIHRRNMFPDRWVDNGEVTSAQHIGIVDAIAAGDARLAQKRLRSHLRERPVETITR